MNDAVDNTRYERQMLLKELGGEGQSKLLATKVLVIGAGGLGCPALQYLVAAGVGYIGIVDGDIIQISNLHRQTLYDTTDVGKMKAIVAKEKLLLQNPSCIITSYTDYLTAKNAWDIIDVFDIILDGSDNFSTRYLVNDICRLQKKPLVYGAIYKYEGQLAVFNMADHQTGYSSNYRDLFPDPPLPGTVPNCNTAGVLGVLPGIIGTMQAAEVIKIITGIGKPLTNTLFSYNLLNNQSMDIEITPSQKEAGVFPASRKEIESYDYNISCDMPIEQDAIEINVEAFEKLIADPHMQVVDVREWNEEPVITAFAHVQIPLSELLNTEEKSIGSKVIFVCQSGIRSKQAVQWANKQAYIEQAYSLKGGLINWQNFQLDKTGIHGA
jgi:molybdopterin/thiamine biosynthesis adenylyltransferase/rhodanese-related sulfurtransferase